MFCTALFFVAFLSSSVYAHPGHEHPIGQSDLSQEYQKKIEEIKELEKKLQEISGQAKTLSGQISNFNTQIQLTQLKVEQTETEIATLSGKIGALEVSIVELSQAHQQRILSSYRLRRVGDSPILFLLSSSDLSTLLSRFHYLRLVEERDRDLLVRLQSSQTNLEQEKFELEDLEKKLGDQKLFLARQRGAKEKLLELTKNDERKFQELLKKARAEQSAIAAAMRNAAALLKDGQPIGKGTVIALIGNSGAPSCSTGPHLHFEVQKDGASVDPAGYLSQRDVIWDNQPDPPFSFGGNLNWPINSPRITQGFGMTYWAGTGFYGGRPHTGIDMTSEDISIRAPVDGTVYKGTVTCGSNPMNFTAIKHNEGGIISWYWHVQ